jgi:uncharacterized protein YjbI with pentapeptide repeats
MRSLIQTEIEKRSMYYSVEIITRYDTTTQTTTSCNMKDLYDEWISPTPILESQESQASSRFSLGDSIAEKINNLQGNRNLASQRDEDKELNNKSSLVQEIITQARSFRNLINADLSNTDLSNVNLTGADLSHANLGGANLTGVNLINADLVLANLTSANLTTAYLHGADLSKANLSDVILAHTDLSNVNLSYARLFRADFTGTDLSSVGSIRGAFFGNNKGISDFMKDKLISIGAIFEDYPDDSLSEALSGR